MDPPGDVELFAMRPNREEDMPKGAYTKKHRFEDFGYTEGCEGCRGLRPGVVPRRPRQESCRKRIDEELAKAEKGRK